MKSEIGYVLAGLLGIGLLLLWVNKSGNGIYDQPRRIRPRLSKGPSGGHRYKNAETWNITWNSDGLPSKVTIERDATQT